VVSCGGNPRGINAHLLLEVALPTEMMVKRAVVPQTHEPHPGAMLCDQLGND
jgi:hypothetical protein